MAWGMSEAFRRQPTPARDRRQARYTAHKQRKAGKSTVASGGCLLCIRNMQPAIPRTARALVPSPVPAGVVAGAAPVWGRAVYRAARDDNWAGAVVVAMAVMLVGEVTACNGHYDYRQYDCRY